MAYNVTHVVDGDTFDVSPKWGFNGTTGNRVRIANYDAAELGEPEGDAATRRLRNLIDGKSVELKNKVNISRGRLVCDVYLNGGNIVPRLK